ncbi:hypothetical protein [uncultured Methylobacterium sp.]|uniref:hypothetical protein n=1 Tax=uncultured Methylobacterium sp. TaxID=157278 RepID=UPI0035C9D4BE
MIGFGPFGIRLPVIMGVTAVSISPMLAMAAIPGVGLNGIYGAVIVGGLFGLCVAPFVKYVLSFFPTVVTGTIIGVPGQHGCAARGVRRLRRHDRARLDGLLRHPGRTLAAGRSPTCLSRLDLHQGAGLADRVEGEDARHPGDGKPGAAAGQHR